MKLVVENSDQDIARNEASGQVEKTLRAFTINFLRVVAGAGRPWQVWGDMIECVEAAQAYQKVYGYGPSSFEISNAVDANRSDREWVESWPQKDREDWRANSEIDVIYAKMDIRQASLRIVAAQMARQLTIQRHAEDLFQKGLQALDHVREERRRAREEASRPRKKKAKSTLPRL